MEQMKRIKENLMCQVQAQMANLQAVDAKELGEVIDMIKDLEEAIYYCTITEAMSEKSHEPSMSYYDGSMMRYTPMYYQETSRTGDRNSANSNGGGSGHNGSRAYYGNMNEY